MGHETAESYDVVLVGAGVVGCAVARDLARYRLRVAVVDREVDVGDGTSKANSGIVHTGFDAKPGTTEARLVARGWTLWAEAAPALQVTLEPVGALLVALTAEQHAELDALRENGRRNGITDLAMVSRDELLHLEPAISRDVRGALHIPGESIIDPFAAVVAQAEHAAVNGVRFFLGEDVRGIQAVRDGYLVATPWRELRTRWLVDAAGLWSDAIAQLAHRDDVRVTPRKGEFVIFDKPAGRLIRHILLPVPTKISKGILVAPTVFGNVLMGPTAVDGTDKTDLSVTPQGLRTVMEAGLRMIPGLRRETVVTTYAGKRAVGNLSDYRLEVDGAAHLVIISGIRSTGLTAAMAIAEQVVGAMRDAGLPAEPNRGYRPDRPARSWRPGQTRPCYDPDRVAQDPRYGRVVCLCETVSEGEIVEALHGPLAAHTLDGVKKRTWATAGRCQAYFCTAALLAIVARERGTDVSAVTKRGPGTHATAGPAGARRKAP